MVKALHAAGLEVILDVVYNHTGEGGHDGPTLSLRGLDNQAYYRLLPHDPSRYMDYTGTGNSLNMLEPHVLQLIMDSLRYWIEEMHVDGFRFDLASALARELHAVDRLSAFFDIIQQDPVIRTVKLIAEPWDVGEGGYQVGEFPAHWAEWNGRYRDTVRDVWRGQPDMLHDFGRRFTGSADLYQDDGRRPSASVNLVTAHDGFTLADLVSYDRKHNSANGDGDRDGESHNRSWNCGVGGCHRRPRHPRRARPAAAQPAGHALPVAGGAHAARRRRAGSLPVGQQQRLLPRLRALVVRLGRRRRAAPRLHAPPHRAAPQRTRSSGVVAGSSTGTRAPRASRVRPTSSGVTREGRACATRSGTRMRRRPSPCTSRAGTSWTPTDGPSWTTPSTCA